MSPQNQTAPRGAADLPPKIKEFLSKFPGTLYTYIPEGPGNDNKPTIHSEILELQRNDQGYGIYFSVNGFFGGKRDGGHLMCINGVYSDIDYPKDMDRTPDNIRQFKNDTIMEMADPDSVFLPTFMVETKNGYHCYWMLVEPIYLKDLNDDQRQRLLLDYRKIQEAIAYRFNGDKNALDTSRVLRVPGTLHKKNPNDPFECKLIFSNVENVFKFSELRSMFLTKPAADAWAEAVGEAGISPEVKKKIEKEFPRLERESYKKLLDPNAEIPEGMRNKALLIAAYACKEAGWDIDKTYKHFAEYHGLTLHEIRKTIRSAYDHEYDFGYNNEVMQAVASPAERSKLSEVTSKVLSKEYKDEVLNGAGSKLQKEAFLTYELVFANRHPYLKYKTKGNFYEYKSGVYVPLQVEDIRSSFLREMLGDGLTNFRKVSNVNDKIACFKSIEGRTFTADDENPDPNILNLANGLLDIQSYELRPHTPEYLSTSQLPIAYDKEASCIRWEKFVDEIMEGDKGQIKLLQQIAGYCLTVDTNLAKAFIFFGTGGNGKSMFTRMLSKLVGRDSVSNLNLNDISRQFGLVGMVGRKLNIIDEISGNYFESNVIKNIISGERMMVDVKFRPEPLEFTPVAKIIFSVNELPKINDTTPGLYRRFVLVPFQRSFISNPDIHLEPKLDAELPGILNWAIEGLKSLRADGYLAETDVNMRWLKSFKMENSPLYEMLERYYIPVPEEENPGEYLIPVMEMYSTYRNFCLNSGYKPKAVSNFLREVINARNEGWNLSKVEVKRKVMIRGIKRAMDLSGEPVINEADITHEPY